MTPTHPLPHPGFSSHPDFEHIRALGSKNYDGSFEPGRWTSFTTITDSNQTRSEWVDVDMEMEEMLNGGYAKVKVCVCVWGGGVRVSCCIHELNGNGPPPPLVPEQAPPPHLRMCMSSNRYCVKPHLLTLAYNNNKSEIKGQSLQKTAGNEPVCMRPTQSLLPKPLPPPLLHQALLERNRAALDELTSLLLERERVEGPEIQALVEQFADKADLRVRLAEAGVELL